MREVAPRAVRLGTVTTKVTSGAQSIAPVLETGRKLGSTVEPINVDDPADLAKALSPEVLAGFDALVFVPDVVLNTHMSEVIKIVSLSNIPAIFPSPDWLQSFESNAYGPSPVLDYANSSPADRVRLPLEPPGRAAVVALRGLMQWT